MFFVQLRCDRCDDAFEQPRRFKADVLRNDLEAIRIAACRAGWARCRPKDTEPMGDFCPDCLKVISGEAARAAKAKGGRSC